MGKTIHTKESLEPIVLQSESYVDVVKKLGLKLAGGTMNHLKSRIKHFDISTAHFKPQTSWLKGKVSPQRKKFTQILVRLPEGSHRHKAYQLRRALKDAGVEYKCKECGIDKWNDKILVLEVDHIDGDYCNNLIENLRFLCPNCHSQTETYKQPKWKV